MKAWLRRNRWGLVALPVTVVLAVGANAQRLQDYWWDQDLRNAAATGSQGEWVTWSDSFIDAAGEGTRTFQVKVTGTESTDTAESSGESEKLALPPDVTALRVNMEFQAAPDQVLFGCRMALLDDDGNRYVFRPGVSGAKRNIVLQNMFPCTPEGQAGPQPSITAGEPREVMFGEQRPPQWATRPVVLAPRSARITQVLLWWEEPDYLAVQVN